MKSRKGKNALFSILDLGGGGKGYLSVPFKKAKIVALSGPWICEF